MTDEPHITYDLLKNVLPTFLDYKEQWSLGMTCRALSGTWSYAVRKLPWIVMIKCRRNEDLKRFCNLKELTLSPQCMNDMTNQCVEYFTQLTKLLIVKTVGIHSDNISHLTSLTELSISGYNLRLVDLSGFISLKRLCLTNVKHLCLTNVESVSDYGISRLTALERLHLVNDRIKDETLRCLTGLTDLALFATFNITDHGLSDLTCLRKLAIGLGIDISDDSITCLTSLTELHLIGNRSVTDTGLSPLSQLEALSLSNNDGITDSGITGLTALRALDLRCNEVITDAALSRLTGLTALDLQMNRLITLQGVSALTSLRALCLSITSKLRPQQAVATLPLLAWSRDDDRSCYKSQPELERFYSRDA